MHKMHGKLQETNANLRAKVQMLQDELEVTRKCQWNEADDKLSQTFALPDESPIKAGLISAMDALAKMCLEDQFNARAKLNKEGNA